MTGRLTWKDRQRCECGGLRLKHNSGIGRCSGTRGVDDLPCWCSCFRAGKQNHVTKYEAALLEAAAPMGDSLWRPHDIAAPAGLTTYRMAAERAADRLVRKGLLIAVGVTFRFSDEGRRLFIGE